MIWIPRSNWLSDYFLPFAYQTSPLFRSPLLSLTPACSWVSTHSNRDKLTFVIYLCVILMLHNPYLLWRFHSGRISCIRRRFLAARAVCGRPTPALLRLPAVLQILLLLHQKTLFIFRRNFEFSVCAPGLTNDGTGYHIGEVLVGLDAVHVLVQDRDLLFVVPSGRTEI